MSNAFRVESASFCDYITEDVGGKPILIGVYHGELRFQEEPETWPVIYLSVVIDPLENNFKLAIEIISNDMKPIIKVDATYSSAIRPPQENRLVMNIQMPRVKFTGAGKYTLKITDSTGESVMQRQFPVNIGPAEPFVPTLSVSASLGEGLTGEASPHPSLFLKR